MFNQYNGPRVLPNPILPFCFAFEDYECFSEFRRLANGHEHRDCGDQE